MNRVKHVSLESFESEVLNSRLPVIVDFYAERDLSGVVKQMISVA